MPITKTAKKTLRASFVKRSYNERRLRAMRDITKKIKKLSLEKKTSEAAKLLPDFYRALDKAAKRGVIKKNTAARKKSRVTVAVNKLAR